MPHLLAAIVGSCLARGRGLRRRALLAVQRNGEDPGAAVVHEVAGETGLQIHDRSFFRQALMDASEHGSPFGNLRVV
jgi:hypothetical protein